MNNKYNLKPVETFGDLVMGLRAMGTVLGRSMVEREMLKYVADYIESKEDLNRSIGDAE